jgi:hypothetical protein
MAKRRVKCEFCGFVWDTQSPFDKFMCPNPACCKQTKLILVKDDKNV